MMMADPFLYLLILIAGAFAAAFIIGSVMQSDYT